MVKSRKDYSKEILMLLKLKSPSYDWTGKI